MTHLSTTSLGDYLDVLAAATPAPGGGSAAGVAGAMGAALVEMVAGLSLAKSIIVCQNGTIQAQNLSQGFEISIHLPLA